MTPEIAHPFQLTFQKAFCFAFPPQPTLHGVELQFQASLLGTYCCLPKVNRAPPSSEQHNPDTSRQTKGERHYWFQRDHAMLLSCYYRLFFPLILIRRDQLEAFLMGYNITSQNHYSQLVFTSFTLLPETIKQMRGRTGLGYSCSSLRLDFYDIKYILSVLLHCPPQSKGTKSWVFLLSTRLQIRTVDTK